MALIWFLLTAVQRTEITTRTLPVAFNSEVYLLLMATSTFRISEWGKYMASLMLMCPWRANSGIDDSVSPRNCSAACCSRPRWGTCSHTLALHPDRSSSGRRWQCACGRPHWWHGSSSLAHMSGWWTAPRCLALWHPPHQSRQCGTYSSQCPDEQRQTIYKSYFSLLQCSHSNLKSQCSHSDSHSISVFNLKSKLRLQSSHTMHA